MRAAVGRAIEARGRPRTRRQAVDRMPRSGAHVREPAGAVFPRSGPHTDCLTPHCAALHPSPRRPIL